MRVLIVKTSSLGDVIHTLPALTDAGNAIPGMSFDWIVEENFAEIPAWHPLVKKIIPIAWRRWRKQLCAAETRAQCAAFLKNVRAEQYDLIIDAQGLVKSAFCARLAKGLRAGPNFRSAREPLAALLYQESHAVDSQQHAIVRMRSLFQQALHYPLPTTVPDYGIDRRRFVTDLSEQPYLVFLHGTTWDTKHWPEQYWMVLTQLANQHGWHVKFPWGNDKERARAERIVSQVPDAEILPRLDLAGMAKVLAGAQAITAVDTGLGHLAAALDVPTVSIYGPTNPVLTGALGKRQVQLAAQFACAPCLSKVCTFGSSEKQIFPACLATLTPTQVWDSLSKIL